MTNLTQFDSIPNDIRSEINVDENGVGSFSLIGVARMCGVEQGTLTKHFNGTYSFDSSKLLQSLASRGIELIPFTQGIASRIPDLAAAAIIEYYAFDAAAQFKNAHIARTSFRFFAAWGIRDFVQRATGWKKPEPSAPVPQKPALSPAQEAEKIMDTLDRFQSQFGSLSPRQSQIFSDAILNAVNAGNALSPASERWLGVVEIASHELGISLTSKGDKSYIKAGKMIRQLDESIVGSKKETRLVNGQQWEVYVYPMHLPEVRDTIVNALRSWYEV